MVIFYINTDDLKNKEMQRLIQFLKDNDLGFSIKKIDYKQFLENGQESAFEKEKHKTNCNG